MPPAGYEPAIPANERPQTFVLRPLCHWDRRLQETGCNSFIPEDGGSNPFTPEDKGSTFFTTEDKDSNSISPQEDSNLFSPEGGGSNSFNHSSSSSSFLRKVFNLQTYSSIKTQRAVTLTDTRHESLKIWSNAKQLSRFVMPRFRPCRMQRNRLLRPKLTTSATPRKSRQFIS
jgi:hypothetical protein